MALSAVSRNTGWHSFLLNSTSIYTTHDDTECGASILSDSMTFLGRSQNPTQCALLKPRLMLSYRAG